jgi:S-DNA-T family DNA segregation ATPase FtsK/SpoIIIE
MGRTKREEKTTKESQNEESSFEWEEVLGSDAKRSIAAIFLTMLGILFFIAFFEAGGALGASLDSGLGKFFGWGKWLFPVLLFVSALFFLRRRETTLSDVVKFIGLGVVFVSLLGFFHLFLGDTGKELLSAAKRGDGGGYVGYGLSWVFLEFTGRVAGVVILSALFLSGLVAAFNVSLMHFLLSVRRRLPRFSNEDAKPEIEIKPIDTTGGVPETAGSPPPSSPQTVDVPVITGAAFAEQISNTDKLKESNIGEIKFPDDGPEESAPEKNIGGVSFSSDDDAAEDDGSTPAPQHKKPRHFRWELPPTDLLEIKSEKGNSGDIDRNTQVIKSTLKYFNIDGEMGAPQVGPTVTQYTFSPAFGTRLSKITSLSQDLSLALAKHPIRVEAPIPGKSLVGIEVPNDTPAKVRMRDILESETWKARKSRHLSVILGEDVAGNFILGDLGSMPHLLIAGATNSGKSVCVNSMLLSLLYQNSPEQLKLILVDPKRVELSLYNGIPHLMGGSVITDNKRVVNALKYATGEMDRRLKLLESVHARDIASYQKKHARGERRIVTNQDGHSYEEELDPLPYLVIVIDEMADLMIAHGKEVEATIVRLAQMSRAVGIHLILATQRPSVQVVTGLIKANIPARAAFFVTNQIDSRTILDTGGAEKLLGKGDMLYSPPGAAQPQRIQGSFVTEDEVKKVVHFLEREKRARGDEGIDEDFSDRSGNEDVASGYSDGVDFSESEDDPSRVDDRYEEAKQIVIESGRAATTYLQRRMSIGYGRAAKLLDLLEEQGIVGIPDGPNKGRRVLVGPKAGEASDADYDDPLADQSARDKWQV